MSDDKPTPRPGTKCRRCRSRYDAHVGGVWCPDASGRTFLLHTPRPAVMRFAHRELATLESVLRNALHAGGSAHELVRLLGKVRCHRERVERQRTGQSREAKAS